MNAKRVRKSIAVNRPAFQWHRFFKRLLGKRNSATHPVEDYVAVFGECFGLAKSWYQFGDRRVLLLSHDGNPCNGAKWITDRRILRVYPQQQTA